MTKFRKLMNTEDRLSSKSMLDEERLDDDDLEEIKQELNDGSYDDYLNLPQSKLQRLSDDESDQLISQLLDYLFYKINSSHLRLLFLMANAGKYD